MLSIARSLDSDGLSPRVHKNTGKPPKIALKYTYTERMKSVLVKYASNNALPSPGRLPGYKNHKVLLLPSDKTSVDIHQEYETLAEEMQYRSVSLISFQRIWHVLCPNIVITKHCTDLCQHYQDFADRISKSGNLSEEEKKSLLGEYNKHVQLAKEQRQYYRSQVKQSKQNCMELQEDQQKPGNAPMSIKTNLHYSWDYAQQVHFPHHAQQVGPFILKHQGNAMCLEPALRDQESKLFI